MYRQLLLFFFFFFFFFFVDKCNRLDAGMTKGHENKV